MLWIITVQVVEEFVAPEHSNFVCADIGITTKTGGCHASDGYDAAHGPDCSCVTGFPAGRGQTADKIYPGMKSYPN